MSFESRSRSRYTDESGWEKEKKPGESAWDGIERKFDDWKKGEGKKTWKWTKRIATGLTGLILLAGSIYIVGPDEEGVIRRFGKYDRSTKSGIHFKMPLVETLDTPKVTEVKKEEFGFRTIKPGKVSKYDEKGDYDKESLMLTGDKAMVDLEFIVQYKIKDAKDYLFNVRDVKGTLRDASEAAMRQVVGDKGIDEALTTEKVEVQEDVKKHLQEILDSYKIGLHVITVRLQDVDPPKEVKDSFIDVNNAKQNKAESVNKAWEAYNNVIPRATGEADQRIKESEAYAVKRVNEAKGDANKFLAIWNEYKKAKDVTEKRIKLEAMEEILQKVKEMYIIDSKEQGLLKLFDLNKGKMYKEGGK